MIDETYLPFTIDQLKNHFAPVGNRTCEQVASKHIVSYIKSAQRYQQFCQANPDRRGLQFKFLQQPCQIQRDENFWTVACLLRFFYDPARRDKFAGLLQCAFPGEPPIANLGTWQQILSGDLHLFFKACLPSPVSYKQWLKTHLEERQPIPYIRDAARKPGENTYRDDLEGPTEVDAILINSSNGFAVLFEAKGASDISYGVTYDLRRNQIARNIDVLLEKNDKLAHPLSQRISDRSLFILLTPECFKQRPHTRLYGPLMNSYSQSSSPLLGEDLPHRSARLAICEEATRMAHLGRLSTNPAGMLPLDALNGASRCQYTTGRG